LMSKRGRQSEEEPEAQPESKEEEDAGDEGEEDQEEESKPEIKIKFRNYNPRTKELQENSQVLTRPTVEKEKQWVKEELKAIVQEPSIEKKEILSIAPRKPNWDLKRDAEPRLEELRKRTQLALIDILRQKVEAQTAEEEDEESS